MKRPVHSSAARTEPPIADGGVQPAIDETALLGRRRAGMSHDSARASGRRGHQIAHIPPTLLGRQGGIGHSIHAYELGSKVKHQRRLQLARVLPLGWMVEEIAHVDGVQIDDRGFRPRVSAISSASRWASYRCAVRSTNSVIP